MKLSTGQCRLLLLSDCIKYFPDVWEHTAKLRAEGKSSILSITGNTTYEINAFLNDEDITKIKSMLMKEWMFTKQVKDNGKGKRTICDYCQKQKIRYRYVCMNKLNRNFLELGSVCVGNIIYGEDKMKDKDFSNSFVEKLENLKKDANADEPRVSKEDMRKSQFDTVNLCVNYLRNNGYGDDKFLVSIVDSWVKGYYLSDKQMEALKSKCKRVREYKQKDIGTEVSFKDMKSELEYKKVLTKLERHPDSDFFKACKLRLERFGELTQNMSDSLAGKHRKGHGEETI